MDDHSDIILFVLEWVWIPLGLLILWSIKRLLGIEKRHHDLGTEIMVLKTNQVAIGHKLELVDERNNEDHTNITAKIDEHHRAVTSRLDSLITIARNGNKAN